VSADDRILLAGIEVYAYGGVTEGEQRIGQRYRLDLDLHLDLATAGQSDHLRDTVSYADVHDVAVGILRERPFSLIEAGAERVASAILVRFPVEAVTVRLAKLLPPIDGVVASAGVEITRRR
jgi:dihydroneopterin aldolase